MDGNREISDRDELFRIALQMKRISDQRLRRARDDLIRTELVMFRIKQEIEDAEARLAAAEAEEAARAEDEEGEGGGEGDEQTE